MKKKNGNVDLQCFYFVFSSWFCLSKKVKIIEINERIYISTKLFRKVNTYVWTKFMVPSMGSIIQVGFWVKFSTNPDWAAVSSSPIKSWSGNCFLNGK